MFKTNILPGYIRDAIPEAIMKELEKGDCWIAGGFIRDLVYNQWKKETKGITRTIKDIDLFFKDEQAAIRCYGELANGSSITFGSWISGYNFPLDYLDFSLNLITHKFFENPEKLLESFNFRLNMFATDGHVLIEHQHAWKDNVNNKLIVNYLKNPVSFMYKMQKYIRKGMEMDKNEWGKLLMRVKLSDYDLTDSDNWYETNDEL